MSESPDFRIAEDKAYALIHPDHTIRFAGRTCIKLKCTPVSVEVVRKTTDPRDVKSRIAKLPPEIDGCPVVIKDEVGSCMFCGYKAQTRREMQRHKCDG